MQGIIKCYWPDYVNKICQRLDTFKCEIKKLPFMLCIFYNLDGMGGVYSLLGDRRVSYHYAYYLSAGHSLKQDVCGNA